jgi:hypothetical protein
MNRWRSWICVPLVLAYTVFGSMVAARAQDLDGFGLKAAAMQSDPNSVLFELFVAGDLNSLYGGDDGLWGTDVLDEISAGKMYDISLGFEYNHPVDAWAAVPVVPGGVSGGDMFANVEVDISEPFAIPDKIPAMSFSIVIRALSNSQSDVSRDVVLATIRVARPAQNPGEFVLKSVRLGENAKAGDGTTTMASQQITPIPEPGTLSFVGVGLCGVVLGVHRRRRLMRG